MTSAVDSTVLFDILRPDSRFLDRARNSLAKALEHGALVISQPAFAEVATIIDDKEEYDAFLREMGIRLVASTPAVLHRAGTVWRSYTTRRSTALTCSVCGRDEERACSSCGATLRARQHIVADFMIGAHAMALGGGRLIARDEGMYRTYFPDLTLL